MLSSRYFIQTRFKFVHHLLFVGTQIIYGTWEESDFVELPLVWVVCGARVHIYRTTHINRKIATIKHIHARTSHRDKPLAVVSSAYRTAIVLEALP